MSEFTDAELDCAIRHFNWLGRYFGYPFCCRVAFIWRHGRLFTDPKAWHPLIGTGYVPCDKCARLPVAAVRRGINRRRRYRQKFPARRPELKLPPFLVRRAHRLRTFDARDGGA